MRLERVGRGPRRLSMPKKVDDALGRDQLIRVQEEQREERSLARASDFDRLRISSHGEGSENRELCQHASSARCRGVRDALSGYFKRPVMAVGPGLTHMTFTPRRTLPAVVGQFADPPPLPCEGRRPGRAPQRSALLVDEEGSSHTCDEHLD